jgi:hypothetical protein
MSVIAEALLVYAGAEWIAAGYGGGAHAISAFSIIAVAITAFSTSRMLDQYGLSPRWANLVAYWAIFGALHIEFAGDFALWDFSWATYFLHNSGSLTSSGGHAVLAALLLFGLWLRCVHRGSQDIELEYMPRTLGISFTAVTVIVVLAAATSRSSEVARAAAAFYAVGVVSLACAQLAQSGATFGQLRAGGITAGLMGGTVLATLVCLVVFGLLFSAFASPIGQVIGVIIEAVLTVMIVPLAWLLQHLFALIFHSGGTEQTLQNAAQQGLDQAKDPNKGEPSQFARMAAFALRVLALAVVAGIVFGLTALVARRRRAGAESEPESPNGGSAGGFGDDLRSLFGSLFRRGEARPVAPAQSPTVNLYRDVLARAKHAGRSRPDGHTPAEFSPALTETFSASVTDDITRAFEQARYAGREPDPATLEDLHQRWRAVR